MKYILTSAAINYSWRQIFNILGVKKTTETKFYFSNKEMSYEYGFNDINKEREGGFYLNVLPCAPNSFENLIAKQDSKVIWLNKKEFLPSQSLDFPVESLPILIWGDSAQKNHFAEIINNNLLVVNVDLIASTFFMLSRVEERDNGILDKYGRFTYTSSSAHRHDYIDLPIIDLYIKILNYWIETLTQTKIKNTNKFTINISHDIDHLSLFNPIKKGCILIIKDALRLNRIALHEDFRFLFNNKETDPYLTAINHLADLSSKFGLKSTFNLMATTPSIYDSGYTLNLRMGQKIIKDILNKGHTIGLHASYKSFAKPSLLIKEKKDLEKITGGKIHSVRSHYLRLKTPESWVAWDSAGFKYDSSYGYAEQEGFRCGTCIPFQVFDISNDKPLSIYEMPLLVMDSSLKTYRNLSINEAKKSIISIAKICKFVGGNFTLLWHNTSFFRSWKNWGSAYPEILSMLSSLED